MVAVNYIAVAKHLFHQQPVAHGNAGYADSYWPMVCRYGTRNVMEMRNAMDSVWAIRAFIFLFFVGMCHGSTACLMAFMFYPPPYISMPCIRFVSIILSTLPITPHTHALPVTSPPRNRRAGASPELSLCPLNPQGYLRDLLMRKNKRSATLLFLEANTSPHLLLKSQPCAASLL